MNHIEKLLKIIKSQPENKKVNFDNKFVCLTDSFCRKLFNIVYSKHKYKFHSAIIRKDDEDCISLVGQRSYIDKEKFVDPITRINDNGICNMDNSIYTFEEFKKSNGNSKYVPLDGNKQNNSLLTFRIQNSRIKNFINRKYEELENNNEPEKQ